ncbi:MAG TPA: cysteine desulfurase NifS [Candidatus Pullichristensenella excrementigallinarum]|uniref:Cysteine desulfurase IscS n=1 Tax=Candidatus Pullichristensenella excrementigallinarum TaxID=2840907 RepID=A0A9D1IAA6_9FIRM|nr:cysteine desulfurase NifS [Candidatus Pullichristensenella excrementigallinarum]
MRVYMDNAATTRVTEPVLEAMQPYFCEIYGNPSSLHSFGREAHKALDHARQQVADAIGANPNEIYFTGCGTESDNWALRGAAYARQGKGRHIITTQIEHHAILHTCEQLEKEGFEVTYLPVDEYGFVRPESLQAALRPDTTIVSIMAANNEIGTVEPIAELCKIAKDAGALFHTDAVQAVGAIPIDVKAWNVDMLSMSGHKLHAPKGVGALYIRSGVRIDRLIRGGAQERNQRAGTENLASIVGLGQAIELACRTLPERAARISALRDHMIGRILAEIPYTRLNGHPEKRLPGNANVSIRFIEGEALLLRLDMAGIAASTGSACASGSLDPSHVLLAIGLPHEIAHGSLRLSLSEENTLEEADYAVDQLKEIVRFLRNMSPLYNEFLKDQEA